MSKPSGYRRLQVPLTADSSFNDMTHQYGQTNVTHFLFSLLRIKGLYMFLPLFAHPQEVLHKRHLVYGIRVMSVGCHQGWSGTRNIPSAVCVAPSEDEQVMLETCRGP
jgi:hypothetical protein